MKWLTPRAWRLAWSLLPLPGVKKGDGSGQDSSARSERTFVSGNRNLSPFVPGGAELKLAGAFERDRNRARTFATNEMVAPAHALEMLARFGLPQRDVPGENLAELEKILTTQYSLLPALPDRDLARELASLLRENEDPRWMADGFQKMQTSSRVRRLFGGRELMVSGEPYLAGSGLSLWGFSFSTTGANQGYYIFANTAHQTGAIAATVEHELGHFVFQAMGLAESGKVVSMEPTFARHLEEKEEMFCDSVVALATYEHEVVCKVSGRREPLANRIQAAWDNTHPGRRIDPLSTTPAPLWRVRYLTALIHFFKIRAALLEIAGV